jgi:hypothetical protein
MAFTKLADYQTNNVISALPWKPMLHQFFFIFNFLINKELMPATNLLLHHTKLAIMPQVQSVIPIQQIIATNASTVIERLQNSTFQHSPSLPFKTQLSYPWSN